MRRGLLLLSTVVICLALAPEASAKKPTRQINPSQDDVVITDQCAFPVLGHIEGMEIIKTWTDDAGNPVKQIVTFPGNRLTLTNLDRRHVGHRHGDRIVPTPSPAGRLGLRPGDGSRAFLPQPDNRGAGDLVSERPREGHPRLAGERDLGRARRQAR